jgi:hypothetical protein
MVHLLMVLLNFLEKVLLEVYSLILLHQPQNHHYHHLHHLLQILQILQHDLLVLEIHHHLQLHHLLM